MGISVDAPHTTSIGKFNSIFSQKTNNQNQDPIVSIDDIGRLSKNLNDSRSDSELVAAISTYFQFVQEKSNEGVSRNFKTDKCQRVANLTNKCIQYLQSGINSHGLNYIREDCNGYFTSITQTEYGEMPLCLAHFLAIIGAETINSQLNIKNDENEIKINGVGVKISNHNRECPISLTEPENPYLMIKDNTTKGSIIIDGDYLNVIRASDIHPITREPMSKYTIFKINEIEPGQYSTFEENLSNLLQKISEESNKEQLAFNRKMELLLFSKVD